jgi:ribosomal protein L14
MIQQESMVKVADNSGAKSAERAGAMPALATSSSWP